LSQITSGLKVLLSSLLYVIALDHARSSERLGQANNAGIGTVLVETPFLLHLAGTSEWQRLAVLGLGLGVIAASALILLFRRRSFSPTQACLVGLETAYIANATLCLVVYSEASGGIRSRSGWLVSIVVIWPIVLELAWLLIHSFRGEAAQTDLSIV
jgi:ABC-type Fe3+-siderophore transport system permease subunit